MRFIMMVKADPSFEAGVPPKPELIAAIGKLTEEMTRSGVMVQTGGLMPSAKGARVRVAGGRITAVDGPFSETKELIGGYAIVDVGSRSDALALARRFMEIHVEVLGAAYEGECEIRQMFEGPDCSGR
ncbi:MAG TPA: YciI family protein [Casimicrobiaceae bacterium]